jgi:hypothetical protein
MTVSAGMTLDAPEDNAVAMVLVARSTSMTIAVL